MTQQFLIFQLYGDMASWGDIAVGEQRPTLAVPTKSALTGLIAAALGIQREDDLAQENLTKKLSFGIQVLQRGGYLSDYHTIQSPSQAALNKKKAYTRKEELDAGNLGTLLSTRDYWVTPYYRIAVQIDNDSELLQKILGALKAPVFTPYLGRKSCPMGLPMNPQVTNAKTFEEALSGFEWPNLPIQIQKDKTEFWWEENCVSNLEKTETVTLRTVPLSRKQWQFSEISMHVFREKGDAHVY